MVILKFIATVIAIITTCMYISNTIADIGSAISWRTSLTLSGEESTKDIGEKFAKIRIILSIIMGIAWGIVMVL